MKFAPRPDYGSFQDTRRKRLAAERRQQRERDSAPLLAVLIEAQQPSIDEVMRHRAEDWDREEQAARDHLAKVWRSVRADIAALPVEQRQQIRNRADHYGGKLDPVAYAYFYGQVTGHHRPGAPCGMGGRPIPS
ncbi:hypothetical protein [Microvirga sesbaniae]|uniref:hypothetical protein n=1 Tax=Microvirga sesbaniae TaxID=681392 RepID=UPI0021CA3BC3|nr:hypothetical protein [Microvirga sp. HBU67692]